MSAITLEAPDGWRHTNIRNISTIRSGSTPSRLEPERYFARGTIPWIKTMDLTNGRIYSTDERITELAVQETSCPILEPGTVLVAMYGGYNQIGRTGLMTFAGSINQAISALVIDRTKAIPEYVLYWLNANLCLWKRFAASSRKDPNITRQDVGGFPILLPPLAEQRKIAAILSTWDEAIALTERLIAALQQRKQGLMQRLLTGQVRFPGFEGEWREERIGKYLAESRIPGSDGAHANKLSVKLYGKGVVRKVETKLGSTNTQYYVRHSGQFIYSKLDFLNGAFGIIPGHLDGYESTLDLPAFEFGSGIDPIYFLNYVSREGFYKRHLGRAIGGRKARRVSPSAFLSIKFPVPPLAEQNLIASLISEAQSQIDFHSNYLEALMLQKKGLMQRLLTGQIRVRVD